MAPQRLGCVLVQTQTRGLFFMGRLLNKSFKKQKDNVINFEET